MKFKRSFRFCISSLTVCFVSFAANAQSWTSRYLEADRAGQLSVCIAAIEYQNAFLSMRLYGDTLDFLYYRDDFTLPWGAELGTAIFRVDGNPFQMFALTFSRNSDQSADTTSVMQILPNSDDTFDLVELLSLGTTLEIVFPNGDVYPTTLLGSANAIAAMIRCWERNQTGPLENNPFSSNGSNPPPASNNPFQ